MNSSDQSLFSEELNARQQLASRLLQAAVARNSFANAYLLTGRQEADKRKLTKELAAFLNCLSRLEDKHFSCLRKAKNEENYCQNCRWIARNEHPQALLTLEGPGPGKKIPVEKARNLSYELTKTSKYCRLICIPHAEQDIFHAESANALLKSIEEPGPRSHFLLFATSPEAVLPTIVSRCQQIPFNGTFQSGLWGDDSPDTDSPDADSPDADSPDADSSEIDSSETGSSKTYVLEERQRLDSLRQKMTDKTSHFFKLPESRIFLHAAGSAQELSRWLLELVEEGFTAENLLDILVAADLSLLRQSATAQAQTSLYLKRLIELSEKAKQELSHYVKEHNVLESFSYQLMDLRSSYLGDNGIAKDLSQT